MQGEGRSSRGSFALSRRTVVGIVMVLGALLLWWLATSGLRLLNPMRLPSPIP